MQSLLILQLEYICDATVICGCFFLFSKETKQNRRGKLQVFPLHPSPPPALIPCKHKTCLSKINAVAEAANYAAVLTKADTEKEVELFCVGFTFVFANLRFVCYGINAMRFFTAPPLYILTKGIGVGQGLAPAVLM